MVKTIFNNYANINLFYLDKKKHAYNRMNWQAVFIKPLRRHDTIYFKLGAFRTTYFFQLKHLDQKQGAQPHEIDVYNKPLPLLRKRIIVMFLTLVTLHFLI